jgi:hypothetical protein
MQVYVVGTAVDHEADSLEAIYSTLEAAVQEAERLAHETGELVFVEEWLLNSNASSVVWRSEE